MTAYDPKFHPKDLVEQMSNGKVNTQIYKKWKIDKSTFYDWISSHKEFSEAYEKGKDYFDAWYWDTHNKYMEKGHSKGYKYFEFLGSNKLGYKSGNDKTTNIQVNQLSFNTKNTEELLKSIEQDIKYLTNNNVLDADFKIVNDENKSNKQD